MSTDAFAYPHIAYKPIDHLYFPRGGKFPYKVMLKHNIKPPTLEYYVFGATEEENRRYYQVWVDHRRKVLRHYYDLVKSVKAEKWRSSNNGRNYSFFF